MEWIASLDFEKLANGIIILFTGFLAAFGFRAGKSHRQREPEPGPATVEVAGALVDGSSVKLLAGEIAGQTLAATAHTMAVRGASEKLEEAMNDLTEQVRELRQELSHVRRG